MAALVAGPLLPEQKSIEVIQTRDFVITTDISGSMDETIKDPDQQNFASGQNAPTDGTQPPALKKIDVAARAIKVFVTERQGDRVALLVFDTDTYYYWPLSRDLRVVASKADRVNKYTRGGTDFDSDNGAVLGAVKHFREASTAKTKVMIIVTDGEASISAERKELLTRTLTEMGIKVYVLGVGDSWVNNSPMTQDLRGLVEGLGGTVIPVGDAAQLRAAFATINQLEKSQVELEKSVSYKPFSMPFLIAAVVLALLYLGLSALVRDDA
jgi:Ca-activated chloride channel family protein